MLKTYFYPARPIEKILSKISHIVQIGGDAEGNRLNSHPGPVM